VAAVAGLDNHARVVPVVRLTYLPYEAVFGTLSTHVLLPEPLTGRTDRDVGAIARALGAGASFLANDALADAAGFRFRALANGVAAGPGEVVRTDGPVTLRVTAPVSADWRVVRAGCVVARAHGRTLEAVVEAPGAYHVQGRYGDRFWLVSNPIYVRATHGGEDRPGEDVA
jgi:hypothetical protein